MDGLRNTLQGSFVYLLVFQILVITGLFLSLIWMLIKRTRENLVTAGIPMPTPPVVPEIQAPLLVEAKPVELPTPIQTVASVVGVAAPVTPSTYETEVVSKNEHIQYLENKLCEYEILQEEIGILQELRAENELLKKQLGDTKIPPPENVVPIRPPADIPPVDPDLGKLMKDIEAIGNRKT